ncbi:HAMP domain-containing sensor histidine kinase [Sphaerisporangium aureirubrum]|uniref:Oxygen sensor histidine kinase NreB n=1 Tax=Sphaerisporangium aureirubrum TaxID=1544736 RepID=A0ABW1N7H6_9ACTN
MAASLVLISAVAALLAAVIAWFIVPRGLSPWIQVDYGKNTGRSIEEQAHILAGGNAIGLGLMAIDLSVRDRTLSDHALLVEAAKRWAEKVERPADPTGLTIVLAVAGMDGRLVRESSPAVYPAGSTPPGLEAGTFAGSGLSKKPGQPLVWVTMPIQVLQPMRVIGVVYVSAEEPEGYVPSVPLITSGWEPNDSGWLGTAGLALLLLVPVCVAFGLLSTRPLISRIRRLAAATALMAQGDLRARVPISGTDEVGRLEAGFNLMTERVEAAARAESEAAGVQARSAERTRIARELHDSISQHLFSVSLTADNLRRTLPEGSRAQDQAESVEQTVRRTMREMRMMLLELRPAELDEAGLAGALREVCQTYQARLGIAITTALDPVDLDPRAEHTVLRVAQEALGNAVKHSGAEAIELGVTTVDDQVEVLVRDHGRGFDPEQTKERHGLGLRLMRERVTELGGTMEVRSAQGEGTTVRVRIPAAAEARL